MLITEDALVGASQMGDEDGYDQIIHMGAPEPMIYSVRTKTVFFVLTLYRFSDIKFHEAGEGNHVSRASYLIVVDFDR